MLMLILGLIEAIDQLAMASSVCRCSSVWLVVGKGHWSCFEKGIKSEGQRKKNEVKKYMEEAGDGIIHEVWFVKGRCALPIKVDCWR